MRPKDFDQRDLVMRAGTPSLGFGDANQLRELKRARFQLGLPMKSSPPVVWCFFVVA